MKKQEGAQKKSRAVRSQVTLADLRNRDWLRPIEAQRLFGIGQSKFNTWVASGAFKAFRPDGGRTIFVRKDDVDQYLRTGQSVTA